MIEERKNKLEFEMAKVSSCLAKSFSSLIMKQVELERKVEDPNVKIGPSAFLCRNISVYKMRKVFHGIIQYFVLHNRSNL